MPSLQTTGIYNLSAPVLGADGQALAALTCPYITPISRAKAPDIPETIRMLADVAARLSEMIGGGARDRDSEREAGS
jgi:DNA-binding IclR family transcriptional regulator